MTREVIEQCCDRLLIPAVEPALNSHVPLHGDRDCVIGEGEIPAKGRSLIFLQECIDRGILDRSRFVVPRFRIISPDLLHHACSLSLAELDPGTIARGVMDDLRVRDLIKESIDQLGVAPLIMRSMSKIEGAEGRSAAGAFESVVVKQSDLQGACEAAGAVMWHALQPYPLSLHRLRGVRPELPGLIVQHRVASGIHVIADSSINGVVKGHVTDLGSTHPTPVSFRFGARISLGEKVDVNDVNKRDLPGGLVAGACEVLEVLTKMTGGPVEIEFVFEPDVARGGQEGKVHLVQYRPVRGMYAQTAISTAAKSWTAGYVIGACSHSVKYGVILSSLVGDDVARQYLMNEHFKSTGTKYVVLATGAIGTTLRKNKHLIPCVDGACALVEVDSVHNSTAKLTAHYRRAFSDAGQAVMTCAVPHAQFAHHHSIQGRYMWDRSNDPYLPPRLRPKIGTDFTCTLNALIFPDPLNIVADEVQQRGGCFIS